MIGDEREGLDEIVWGERDGSITGDRKEREGWEGFDGVLDAGDAVFLPMGWWHSLKGVGEGVVGSVSGWEFFYSQILLTGMKLAMIKVNWWFR